MHAFWESGYGLSVDTLVAKLGTTRFALYSQFGSKQGLFERALERYARAVVAPNLGGLAPGSGRAGLEAYFERALSEAEARGWRTRGCLMANTMVELGVSEPRIASQTRAHFQRLRRAFARALDGARPGADARRRAAALAAFAQGLFVSARAGVSLAALRDAVSAQLDALAPREATR